MQLSLTAIDPVFAAYLLVFSAAAVACFVSLSRLDRITDVETRRGLQALLVTSGAWAAVVVAFLAAPSTELKLIFHLIGLVLGFASVGPWLYFCSAYTGRSLHRNPTVRRLAVAIFLIVVAVKLTNPIHQLYFTTTVVAEPFPHLAIQEDVLHWVVMSVSYAAAAIGYFMLFEMFMRIDSNTRPLAILVSITALPALLAIASITTTTLIRVAYEPLGVAVFAVGVTFLSLKRFQSVQLAGGREEPVIVLDDAHRIRDYNSEAARLFPDLKGTIGDELASVLPAIDDVLDEADPILSFEEPKGTRYYRLSANPVSADGAQIGRLLVFSDVTHREQYRRELERQNDRLEQFASMVSHDLRNPLMVARARLEHLNEEQENEHLVTAMDAVERMEDLIDDLLALARKGQPVDDPVAVSLEAVAGDAWGMVETADATLDVAEIPELRGDPDRLQQLFENLFRNAFEHGAATELRVGPLADGFYVADNGKGIAPADRDEIFDFGFTTTEDGTGFGLAIVGEIADAHGWTVSVGESADSGAQFEFHGVNGA
jgi:signal transduction histidine kinase